MIAMHQLAFARIAEELHVIPLSTDLKELEYVVLETSSLPGCSCRTPSNPHLPRVNALRVLADLPYLTHAWTALSPFLLSTSSNQTITRT